MNKAYVTHTEVGTCIHREGMGTERDKWGGGQQIIPKWGSPW